tara:strand:- start:814 stop:2511 length:1698 start_codon:yes stop_codon:yes gene_type:complete
MLLREWVEALNVLSAKDQHIYAAAMRINPVFQSIARFHNWSWLKREFSFTTQAAYQSINFSDNETKTSWVVSTGSQGEGHLTCLVVPETELNANRNDIGIEWTGAEALIVDSVTGATAIARIKKIAGLLREDMWGYTAMVGADVPNRAIYLDRDIGSLGFGSHGCSIKVFRREYLPLAGEDHDRGSALASRIMGEIYSRKESADAVLRIDQSQREVYGSRYTDTSVNFGAPQTYTVERFNKLPTPKHRPLVVDTDFAITVAAHGHVRAQVNNTHYPAAVDGDYYLACSYYCPHTGQMGDLGPITKYVVSATGKFPVNRVGVVYDAPIASTSVHDALPGGRPPGGFPEESYQLLLWISDANPTGLNNAPVPDGDQERNDINSRYIPFYLIGKHSMHSTLDPWNTGLPYTWPGAFLVIEPVGLDPAVHTTDGAGSPLYPSDENGLIYFNYNVTENRRYYPTGHSELLRLTEAPIASSPYCVNGYMRMPWFCAPRDTPPIPDDMMDMVSAAVSIGIRDTAGVPTPNESAKLQYMLTQLRSSDLKKSQSGSMDYRYRGGMPYIDRYRID